MQCEVVGCQNEADPRLVHKYSGKSFCLGCAVQINGWNPKEDVVAIPEGMELPEVPAIPVQHPATGLFVPRKRIKGPE